MSNLSRVCTGLKGSVDVSHTPTYAIHFWQNKTNHDFHFLLQIAKFVEQGVGFVTASGFVTLTAPDLFS